MPALALALLVGACSDPNQEAGIVGQPPDADPELDPDVDPTRGVDRFLAQLRDRTGYDQTGFVEVVDDGPTILWVHVDPPDQAWVSEQLESTPLEGLEVVATQPVGGRGDRSPDARRYTTDELTGYREALAAVVADLADSLASGEADDPDALPTTANIAVRYDVVDGTFTAVVEAYFDRLPASAASRIRELVPADALDLVLAAER